MPSLMWTYEPFIKKDGKPGRRMVAHHAWYCRLDQCDRCGRVGQTGRVKRWWYRLYTPDATEPVLCLSCFNRLRPLWKAERDLAECTRLLNKIKREITRANKDGGRTTGVSG